MFDRFLKSYDIWHKSKYDNISQYFLNICSWNLFLFMFYNRIKKLG